MSTLDSLVNMAEKVVQMHDAGALAGPKDSNAIRELGRLIAQYTEEQGPLPAAASVAEAVASTGVYLGEKRVHRIGQEKMTDPSAFDFVMAFSSPPYDGELHVGVKAMKDGAFKFQFTRARPNDVENTARETLRWACEEILAAMKGGK